MVSPPSRAAWIEIPVATTVVIAAATSPPSRAAWIEINAAWHNLDLQAGRRLHGRRGLKSAGTFTTSQPPPSPPSRAAWIEILRSRLPPRPTRSPPSRAAWIEIGVGELGKERLCVAAFTGGVD